MSFLKKLKDNLSANLPKEDLSVENTTEEPVFKKILIKAAIKEDALEEPLNEPSNEPQEEDEPSWPKAEGELVIDVYQTDNDIVIQTAIAGVKAKDLDISIENDMVTIVGERKDPNASEPKKYYCEECYWGAFSRQIILPEEVDPDKAKTSMKNGVLTIRLPLLNKQKTRKIEVEEL
ncbi:MAG: Hsp20/alpha crystallin family protein [bacterium]|nr:Hsp20/alpha crystallin family protein [bacterium]